MPVSIDNFDIFARRHIGPDDSHIVDMLRTVGARSLEELIDQTVPSTIRLRRPLDLPSARTEQELIEELQAIAAKNEVWRSFLGTGYSDCVTPAVIQRNVLENPGWYTQYTPYQAELAQGRLEALLNFQTMVSDLTALEIANASLLDEATAAAEAMHMMESFGAPSPSGGERRAVFLAEACHPQTIEVLRTRARAHRIEVIVGDPHSFDFRTPVFGVILAYPGTDGRVEDLGSVIARAHAEGAKVTMTCDLLSLSLLVPPGELGADIAVGSAQRFGVPLGYGGPHAAFFACKAELVRKLPGRIIGVSIDAHGKRALRMALQTREQHIRREKATSNVCTAQALLAIVASMYAVYHGPEGLRAIATRVHGLTASLACGLQRLGVRVVHPRFFDTLRVEGDAKEVGRFIELARERKMNLRRIDERSIGIALDETTSPADVDALLAVFNHGRPPAFSCKELALEASPALGDLSRSSPYLTHPVFNTHHSETEMLRYLRTLESRDLSLAHSMIPLGSCTMKLNATVEMMPITWTRFARMHPFAPVEQAEGYQIVIRQLEAMLSEITGFPAVSLQPNSGAQGELAGLLVIRKYHESRGEPQRDLCLIPASAHGTNPASAAMAGMRVLVVACDEKGYVDVADLEAKARENSQRLAALMVTYPSTYGIFEEDIERICAIVHEQGGQVYLDGANLNAQVGLCRPADVGADVCHVNLHKTFCIPHGGGGPGMGPIGVAEHLAKFLPGHPLASLAALTPSLRSGGGAVDVVVGGEQSIGAVSAAPWGSASILLISWSYIALMGAAGLKRATEVAILSANYVAERMHPHFPVFYRGKRGRVAHECILDTRGVKRTAGIEVDDIAKRLVDFGFHAPTMSFPIAGTLMVEPTESESKAELDRFCDAMIAIRDEIRAIEENRLPRDNNPLKHAPHTAEVLASSEWPHPYSREQAAFPAPWTRERKFWPAVGRVNNAQGDRNLICTCPPIEAYVEGPAPAPSR